MPIPSLGKLIELHESILAPVHPSRVVGIGLNCHGMSADEYATWVERIEGETGLPAADCLRSGAGALVDALVESPK